MPDSILDKLQSPEVLRILRPAGIGALAGGGGLGLLDYLRSDEEDQGTRVRNALSSGLLGAALGGATGAGIGALDSVNKQSIPTPTNEADNPYTLARGLTSGKAGLTGAAAGGAAGGGLMAKRYFENKGVKLPEKRVNFNQSGGGHDWASSLDQTISAKPTGGLTEAQLTALKNLSIPSSAVNTQGLTDSAMPPGSPNATRSTGNLFGRLMEKMVYDPAKAVLPANMDPKFLRPKNVSELVESGGDLSGFRNKLMSGRVNPLMLGLGAGGAAYGGTKMLDDTSLGLWADKKFTPSDYFKNVVNSEGNVRRAVQDVASERAGQ